MAEREDGAAWGSGRGFDHDRLDAYRLAIEVLEGAAVVARAVPARDEFMRSQLLRSCTSVCFNIAEGAGEFSAGDKARFYRMARRSATESAAILDAFRVLGLAPPAELDQLKQKLSRVTAMLTRLVQQAARRQPANPPTSPSPKPAPLTNPNPSRAANEPEPPR